MGGMYIYVCIHMCVCKQMIKNGFKPFYESKCLNSSQAILFVDCIIS